VNHLETLDALRIATPCPIGWEQMKGNERVRFCGHCQLNVYNIAALSVAEAESLIASSEGRICARLFRRADGTVLTRDCPVGLRAFRRRVSKRAAAAFATVAGIAVAVFGQQGKPATLQTKTTSTNASAQNQQSGLTGVVLDPNGAVIPGVMITATKARTKEPAQTFTTEAGRFEFGYLTAGEYSIAFEIAGFKSVKLKNLRVENNKLLSVKVTLEPSFADEVIGVVVIPGVVDSQPGTTIITGDMIRRLPVQE
jgi:Carboxypeptidase regulatory-like domain